ncbi:hypothetical protein GFS60_06874 (plasmid) [Rhodococcus sp. WAY2]|nr:hypothetical protein GFS60_06874 [Rhodococcus sp. WAY2]
MPTDRGVRQLPAVAGMHPGGLVATMRAPTRSPFGSAATRMVEPTL